MIRLCIIGLGRMGAGYPEVGGEPRNHLAAALATPGLEVTALVDPDETRRAEAARHVPTAACFADFSDVPAGSADLVIDARPPADRTVLVRAAHGKGARAILFEKPLALSLAEAQAIAEAVAETGLTARINFHRRFDPRHRKAREMLGGKPVAVSAHYGKGLANYGSHIIDLTLDWIGPIEAVRALPGEVDGDDPSIGFDLRFVDGAEGTVRAVHVDYDLFEVSIFTRYARLDIHNGGTHMRLARAVDDLVYPGYRHLKHEAVPGEGSPVSGLRDLHAALVAHLAEGVLLAGATINDAVAGMAVLDAVHRSHADGGSWQSLSRSLVNA